MQEALFKKVKIKLVNGVEEVVSIYPSEKCLSNQTEINSKMRKVLIDWLVEVHLKFNLLPETLFIAVNLIDRYCQNNHIQRSNFQLVGVTCLLIASKYEEIYPP
jgi:hypothetical protein